jgi:hypothetical protein
VGRALIDPDEIEQYMFGSRVETDWEPGSPLVWRGTMKARPTRTRARSSLSSPSIA